MKLLLTVVAAAAALTVPANARPTAPITTVVVNTADLDLASAAGQSRLHNRIHRAAATACGEASALDVVGQNRVRRCRAETVSAVAPQRDAAVARSPLTVASAR